MNNAKKLALMKVTDTYWDMLPVEVQIYIWKLKVSQEYQDELHVKQQRQSAVRKKMATRAEVWVNRPNLLEVM